MDQKIIPFRAKRLQANRMQLAEQAASRSSMEKAVSKLYKQTGIDFSKVAIGDEKENQRLRFKHYQDAVRLSSE
ncbi:hypothetical protein LOK74_02135 [Brevibacillus humidisoli]|uniref:hypothetical protein n=1 Tax=Brevibacillus humidisoli TaxID=2895522 RepID=UPI001E2E28E8|nr:hypothetical protein [Brevibacillus humidisoli]UFJ41360.1 hypothetical protein LOK74_02135 [Brevibacillus humidisoli]